MIYEFLIIPTVASNIGVVYSRLLSIKTAQVGLSLVNTLSNDSFQSWLVLQSRCQLAVYLNQAQSQHKLGIYTVDIRIIQLTAAYTVKKVILLNSSSSELGASHSQMQLCSMQEYIAQASSLKRNSNQSRRATCIWLLALLCIKHLNDNFGILSAQRR